MPLCNDSLRTIHVIAQSGSFAIAAERLNRVPSSVSYSVKKIEEELGISLFDRTGRQVKLTVAGEYFIKNSQWMLHSYKELVRNSALISTGINVSFTIAINNIINRDGLIDLAERLNEKFPATQITFKTEVYNGCWDALYDGRADLIIGAPHSAPKMEGVIYHPIGNIEWDFVVAQSHPLASKVSVLSAEELRYYPAIVVKDTSQHISQQNTWSLTGQKVIYAPELSTAIKMIQRGVGIGYIPHLRVKELLDQGTVLKKAIVEHKQPTQLFYAWQANQDNPVLNWCTEYLMRAENIVKWNN
ncbi:LysR substrate-binding domain-containing protein [Vibrio algarum]|uniref:LysR substrate-binding domain-containing protein n=1 Tax=Vibrio algarum TaxID=3020714 RepID=A0ABT4YVM7_9VIBR|nr:LysR substrate-binding domain-containing protein [Vibrio sp. KJ40-1]MDB1125447.1 LysR substrate-binding domain-containing protein [Vibrio sp. KJ40-1]